MHKLVEDTRSQLINFSRRAEKEKDGKNRYEKRTKSRISNSTRDYNEINMNSFFKEDILTVNINVHGETADYVVTVSFGGVLDNLHKYLENDMPLSLRFIIKALVESFNRGNVYVRCNCPDATYRFNYWMSADEVIYGERQSIPSDITNPDNTLGRGCKHVMLVLANHSWLLKVASVIWNYINYMEKYRQKLYQTVIYPALYEKEYEEVQLDIFDDELESDKDALNQTTEWGKQHTKFQKDNPYRFKPKTITDQQLTIDEKEVSDEQ